MVYTFIITLEASFVKSAVIYEGRALDALFVLLKNRIKFILQIYVLRKQSNSPDNPLTFPYGQSFLFIPLKLGGNEVHFNTMRIT